LAHHTAVSPNFRIDAKANLPHKKHVLRTFSPQLPILLLLVLLVFAFPRPNSDRHRQLFDSRITGSNLPTLIFLLNSEYDTRRSGAELYQQGLAPVVYRPGETRRCRFGIDPQ